MGLISRGLCWKLMGSISESETPAAYIGFHKAIRDAAIAEHLNCSVNDRPLAESKIRQEMIEAIGLSLQPRPATLPAIINRITIQSESWHIVLNATAIPHLRVSIVERRPTSESEIAYRFLLVRNLVKQKIVGFGMIENEQLHGSTWGLYLFCKIRKLKMLSEAFSILPFRKHPVLMAPDLVFPLLAATLPDISTIKDDGAGVRKFLDECDEVLLAEVGQRELARYLEDCSISPKKFLRAQSRGFFG